MGRKGYLKVKRDYSPAIHDQKVVTLAQSAIQGLPQSLSYQNHFRVGLWRAKISATRVT